MKQFAKLTTRSDAAAFLAHSIGLLENYEDFMTSSEMFRVMKDTSIVFAHGRHSKYEEAAEKFMTIIINYIVRYNKFWLVVILFLAH